MSQCFVLHYAPGPAWLPGRPVFEQPLQAHLAYLKTLHQQGRILAGGPYADHSGGLVILTPTKREEAEKVFRADPAVNAGIMTALATPWHRMFHEEAPGPSENPH